MARIARHGVIEIVRFVGLTEARHVHRKGACEATDMADERSPIFTGTWIAVNEDNGFFRGEARGVGRALHTGRANTLHDQTTGDGSEHEFQTGRRRTAELNR